jgi:hypothetical protein
VTDPSASPSLLGVSTVAASRYDGEIGEIFRFFSSIHYEFIALFLNAAMKYGVSGPQRPRRSREGSLERKEATPT